jgi:hypothetical protein
VRSVGDTGQEVGGIRFIVVGDLPESELQKVIDSLR